MSQRNRLIAYKSRKLWGVAGIVATLSAVFAVRAMVGTESATAQAPRAQRSAPAQAAPPAKNPSSGVVAIVNGQQISRTQLADAAVFRHGEGVLESLVNKRLIDYHCRKRGIQVTKADIDAEINQMAERFQLSRPQYLELLQNERGINESEYARDIVWPTIALRKLAAGELTVSADELQKAYETQYGPAVRARLIVVDDASFAQQLQQKLQSSPEEFPQMAINYSKDVNSASIGGLIQPIRHHMGDPTIEREAFRLQPGGISPVIQVGNQFALLKCEAHVPARNVPLEQVRGQLAEQIKEEKLRDSANELFARLQKSATIRNVYNDPQMSQTMPGVVATLNGEQISMHDLGEECLARHGEEVLQIEISHLLLSQALHNAKLEVTQEDLQAEVQHAANLSGITDDSGQPDVAAWMKMATEDRGVSQQQYVRDSVWPSAALKKLTSGTVEISPEDLQKAFDANYGEKIRCQAIVLGNARRAQQVWDEARRNNTEESFGELAAQYSIEPTTKSLRGEVPPIRRHGGRPQLEEEAFRLNPGELSGIIQMADKYIVLRCIGRTEPIDVELSEVRHILENDLHEKKLRIAMAERFEMLQESAQIENILAGRSQQPKQPVAKSTRRDNQVRPTAGVRQ